MSVGRNTAVRDRHRRTIARGKPPCHICGTEIDYDADHLDPMSFTVDHIVPVSKGGADTLENKAAAHRRCNRIKSDRTDDMPRRTYVTTRKWSSRSADQRKRPTRAQVN
ncbi:HNH endonuclease [Mycobacteroides abscessus]